MPLESAVILTPRQCEELGLRMLYTLKSCESKWTGHRCEGPEGSSRRINKAIEDGANAQAQFLDKLEATNQRWFERM